MSIPDAAHVGSPTCRRVDRALALLGRSRCGAVAAAALDGATRYRDFFEAVPGISHAVLAARLRELVSLGLLEHRDGTYRCTAETHALAPTFTALEELVSLHPHLFDA
ncbi:winged helix-turn-helix transcriptional regulator [Nocardioides yefusunii]|uniref:Winged helix-turn-helix transcriptional regulator n=1 Tax=Nocardioides yefusunii TaxID=2500546 RepID=A0ABW1QV18_9ACTN|nr:winged helix-turn-helix transcriptional regulator [Nocardioides yefusunii]